MAHKFINILSIAAVATAAVTNTNLQTAFPAASGTTNLAAAKTIAAGQTYDGEMKQWDRSPSTCNDQAEGGTADAVFVLQDGATLSNVVVGMNCNQTTFLK
jgi:pectate lyase